HAFQLWNRKYLAKLSTKDPFHHHLDEGLWHVGEAHFQDLWRVVSGIKNISELRNCKPKELIALATKIVDEHMSLEALVTHGKFEHKDDPDEVRHQAIQFNKDVLHYFEMSEATKVSDVGRMEDTLPAFQFRCIGGENSNYTSAVLEQFHYSLHEMTDEMRDRYIWVINPTGCVDGFYPVDMAQERNVKSGKSDDLYASWNYIGGISPAIPIMRAVKDHIEAEFNTASRVKKHTTLAKEKDIRHFMKHTRRKSIFWHNRLESWV
ncbi:hypothetical protein M422DRAFT_187572, partial [Sphaerobolus stellatus SS14]